MATSAAVQEKHVRVGVGVLIPDPQSPSKVFCGVRKGSHGAGMLALPGGHLEMFESWHECAAREVLEEMNLEITDIEFCHVTNDPMPNEDKHYVTIFMMGRVAANSKNQTPQNMEPNKCEGWNSYTWDELQSIADKEEHRLFGPLYRMVKENPKSIRDFLSITTSEG